MALTYAQITAITENTFLKKLSDGVYDSNAVLKRMTRPGQLMLKDGGVQIFVPIISSKPTAGGYYNDLDTLDTSRTDNITAAVFAWKQLYEPIRVSRKEMLQNNGDAAKLSLIASKVQIAEKQIKENLALGFFSDGTVSTGALSANQLTGTALTLSTSSTYGGIAVADLADWIAYVDNNSSVNRAVTLGLMQKVFGGSSEDDEKPTMICCKQNVYDQVWSLFQPHQRLMSEEMSKLGFDNVITFNGVPILVDSHVPANEIHFYNENHLKLCVHVEENLRKETIERLETSNSMLMRIFWMGNVVCSNRRFQGLLDDISVA